MESSSETTPVLQNGVNPVQKAKDKRNHMKAKAVSKINESQKSLDYFIEEDSQRIFKIEPIISYNFTTWVNGNIHFLYQVTDDKIQGRTELKDIGFFLSFKIRG